MQHRRSKIIALGRRGLAIAQIKRLVGGASAFIKGLLLADGQVIRQRGIH
jgi:hypothetical protein